MPIYEYACNDCDDRFEKLVRSTTAPVEIVCPTCGSTHVIKQMSTFAAQVAGGASRYSEASASSCSTGST